MAIQHWDPIRDLLHLQERMNRLFEDVLARSGEARGAEAIARGMWKPPVDIFERDRAYVVRADLPGMGPDDVEVLVEGDALVLRGQRDPDPAVPREAYLRAERPAGKFSLQISLPGSVDRQAIQARHKDGVLEIVLPTRREDTPSRVKVSVA